MVGQENAISLAHFGPNGCMVGGAADGFVVIAVCYERAGLVAVCWHLMYVFLILPC